MKRVVKNLLLALPGFEALCRALTRGHVRALMYHRFCPDSLGPYRHLDRDTLDAQAAYIQKHHPVINPAEHLEAVQGGKTPAHPVVLTCDDGYADFFEIAFPVFKSRGLPAMLFITTGFVSGENWFWWDKIEFIVSSAASQKVQIELDGNELLLDLTSAAARDEAWNNVADRCRFLEDSLKEDFFRRLATVTGVDLPASPPARFAPATWDQVREMADNGILAGAHTRTHPILTRVGLEQVEEELAASRQELEERLDRPVPFFCYPQGGPGDYNEEIRNLTAKYFQGSYLAYQEMNNPDDPYTMPRYGITRDMAEFRWFLCGAEFLGLRLRQTLGLRTGVGEGYWAGSLSTKDNP